MVCGIEDGNRRACLRRVQCQLCCPHCCSVVCFALLRIRRVLNGTVSRAIFVCDNVYCVARCVQCSTTGNLCFTVVLWCPAGLILCVRQRMPSRHQKTNDKITSGFTERANDALVEAGRANCTRLCAAQTCAPRTTDDHADGAP